MTTRHTLSVLLAVAAAVGVRGDANDDFTYARIQYAQRHRNGTVDLLEQMSGVYALYSPGSSVSGQLVIANPLDGCSDVTLPQTLKRDRPFVLLTRLDSSSTCSPYQQAQFAESVGAAGVINMAPTRSSFIYLLEKRAAEVNMPDPEIPQIAISGSSGYRLLTAALNNPHADVSIAGPSETTEEESTLDLVIAVACMVVALIVLAYAFRVGRTLCLQPAQFVLPEESVEDLEERRQKVKCLLTTLPVKPYDGEADAEDVCAICLEQFEPQEEVRVLRCNHFFHVECIDPWLLNKANCPLCKDEVLEGVDAALLSAPETNAPNQQPLPVPVLEPEQSAHVPQMRSTVDAQGVRVTEIELTNMDPSNRRTMLQAMTSDGRRLSTDGRGMYLPVSTSPMMPAISASSLDTVSTKPPLSAGLSNSSMPPMIAGGDQRSEPEYLLPRPAYDMACVNEEDKSTIVYDNANEASTVAYDNLDANGEQIYGEVETDTLVLPLQTQAVDKKTLLSRLHDQAMTMWDAPPLSRSVASNSTIESMHSIV